MSDFSQPPQQRDRATGMDGAIEQLNNLTLEIKRFLCWEFLGLGGKEIPPTAANQ